MRVDWAIPCRYVEVVPDHGATIVGAGADVVTVDEVPAAVQMTFAVRFVGGEDELDGEVQHPVMCRLYDPDGALLGEQSGMLTVDGSLKVPGYVAEIMMPFGVVIDAQRAGTFSVEFEIDGDSHRVPVHIRQHSE